MVGQRLWMDKDKRYESEVKAMKILKKLYNNVKKMPLSHPYDFEAINKKTLIRIEVKYFRLNQSLVGSINIRPNQIMRQKDFPNLFYMMVTDDTYGIVAFEDVKNVACCHRGYQIGSKTIENIRLRVILDSELNQIKVHDGCHYSSCEGTLNKNINLLKKIGVVKNG